MIMITRLIENAVYTALSSSKQLVLLFGPRQAGKTTLLNQLQARLTANGATSILSLNCDMIEDRSLLNTTSITKLKQLLLQTQILMIDEAQRLTDPGLTLKIIHDQFPNVRVIATGSSSLQLRNKTSDALTGRYKEFTLYPLSFAEILSASELSNNLIIKEEHAKQLLSGVLMYGGYPGCYNESQPFEKQQLLNTIQESYLFKDILAFQKVRSPDVLMQLTKALAYQVGSEVSFTELAKRLHIDTNTVQAYVTLLEQTYVIVRVHPYAKNLRKEIGRKSKIYFVDVGLRNALIGDFNDLSIRSDAGGIWENFFIMERIKQAANKQELFQGYFWRTYNGAEVDWIEKPLDSQLRAFECKLTSNTVSRGAYAFTKEYNAPVSLVNTMTYFPYIS